LRRDKVSFENYSKYINYKKEQEEVKTKKYVVRLELGSPVIDNFLQADVQGRNFKGEFKEGKIFNYKEDIHDVIEQNKKKVKDKANAAFAFLEIIDTSIILGIEISEEYDKDRIARFIGNFFSKPLFHDKQWYLIVDKETHLFRIKEFAEYDE
jgi:hypothetical protein